MPIVGSVVELGAYPNHPPLGAPPRNQLEYRNSPPKRNTQKLNAFRRGNATSRAPIINGMK